MRRIVDAIIIAIIILALLGIGFQLLMSSNAVLATLGIIIILAAVLLYKRGA